MNTLFSKEVLEPILYNILHKPDLISFCISEEFYTYKDLGENISKVRQALHENGTNDSIIGLVANDDLETYASILALWLEGKSYVPLHPSQPLERCMDIVDQTGTTLILDSSEKTFFPVEIVLTTSSLRYRNEYLDCTSDVKDSELAYILFTSGSTGKPKGVMITRENLGTFVNSFWRTGIQLDEEDRCLQCFDLTFDVSVQSFLVGLIKGASVYTVPVGQLKYLYVSGLLNEHHLTFGAMAPSMLRYLQPYFDEIDASSLKACILTAEACPLSLAEAWSTCARNAVIYDFYGPTEATIYCTYYELKKINENKSLNGIISIGKPMPDLSAILVDENNDIVSDGQKGELCIAGGQITPGYWKDTSRNSSAFFYKEIGMGTSRFYHTGDLCSKGTDGNIMYIGRMDQQVKIQGFRVEMGEIEYHSRMHLVNINTAAIAFEDENKFMEIALFIESDPFPLEKLVSYLKSKLPAYMMPSRMVFEPVFPLNANYKIDRNKLKEKVAT